MADDSERLDQIVNDLLAKGGTKQERMRLLRELVQRGEELPDELLDSALQKLMEQIAD